MRRVIASVLLVTMLASGCMSAPRTIASPRTYIPMNRPSQVWLTTEDGERMVVTGARILPGDTLFARSMSGEEVWLHLSQIQRVQARQLDKKKTALVVGGALAAAGIVVAIAAGVGSGVDRDVLDRPEMSVILFRSR
jgi:hypothetical protein